MGCDDYKDFTPNMSDIGPVNDEWYREQKLADRGYPGLSGVQVNGGVDVKKAAEILSSPGVFIEVTGEKSVNYEFLNLANEEQIAIVREVLPAILNQFLRKNKDYTDFQMADLGAKAHFVGIWRKVGKLKRALWDGEPLEYEQVSEVIDDLIGHLLLARLGLDRAGE